MDFGIVAVIIMGGIMGECMRHLSFWLIKNRTGQDINELLIGRLSFIVWVMAGSLGCLAIYFLIADLILKIEYMVIFLALLSLSIIDLSIRKIPNELILALLAIELGAIVVTGNFMSVFPAFAGFLVGFTLFLIPSFLGMDIGWGDIKLAAAAGFCLNAFELFQVVLIMAVIMALYLIYLIITKKGNFKTKVAIGPPFSAGMMITLLFPLTIFF